MDYIPFWTLIPILTSLLLGLAWLWLARRHKWSDAEPEPARDSEIVVEDAQEVGGDFKFRLRTFISTYHRELLLAGVLLGLTIFAFLSAPVQMTGEISKLPQMPGRPFFFIHWQRNHLLLFYFQTASVIIVITGLLALSLTIAAVIRRSPQKVSTSLLWSLMALAGSAQWMVAEDKQRPIGIVLYLLSGIGFLIWSFRNNQKIGNDIESPSTISKKWEITLVMLVVALAAFGRLYALKSVPYGIEGDEAKWTAEVVSIGIRGEYDSNGLYHRDALPVSFYMQTIFHKLLGPSLYAARLEVALFSILGCLVFYFFLRQITTKPLALLAAWLLSASIFDISASRLANVESHVKIWPLLALCLLAWAMHKKHWVYYSIAGIALAIGVLTYDTVLPLGLVMIVIVVVESIRQKLGFGEAMRNLMAMLTPSLLTFPFLIPYFTGRFGYYGIDNQGIADPGMMIYWEDFKKVMLSWFVRTFEDFLYNRRGPLLNAFLLPWLTFGFAAVVATIRRRLSFWTLVWVLLFIFPVPIAAHSPFGRVYYPALPAMYILAGIGLYLFTQETVRALGKDFKPLITAIAFAVLFWLPLFNLYIYFNEVVDFGDRQMRREVAEMAKEAASEDNFLVLASVPRGNEALNNEYQMIELFMMEKLPVEQINSSYKNVPLEEVLPTLANLSSKPNRSILLDKATFSERKKRDDLANALRTCFPNATWKTGLFFERVDIDAESLANPACTGSSMILSQDSANQFSWELTHGAATQVNMACEILNRDRDLLEAETFNPYPGWQAETAFATGWNGNGFLMDNYGSIPTLFDIEVEEDKPVYLWVRFYQRVVDEYPAELFLNGQTFSFNTVDGEKLNQWIWERVGPFDAPTGLNTVGLNRPYNGVPYEFMALFIDSIIVTTDPNFSPTENYFSALPSIPFNFQNELKSGSIILPLEPGDYRCTAEAVNKNYLLVDAFGYNPVRSNSIELTIDP
jgi:4-amino-4-deoxy-L-arabinose transferase-like glycosyltransferase